MQLFLFLQHLFRLLGVFLTLMSSEQTAASPAVIASCAGGGTLTSLVSTNTVFRTQPTATRTYYRDLVVTDTEIDGTRLFTSTVIQTVRLASIPIETRFEPVTYSTCVGATLTAPSVQSSTIPGPTEAATSPVANPNPRPTTSGYKTLLITTTIGSISAVCIIAIALGIWIWRRSRKRKLKLSSSNELIEAASFPYSPGRKHRKFSVGTTINDTASTNPTRVDYVGLMPSVSQRNLVGHATDTQSAVDTDWSNVRRSSIALPREHGITNQYLMRNRVSTRPSQSRHQYTSNYNAYFSLGGSETASQIPTAESYTSRGTSAFLRPTESIRAQNREFSYRPEQEHILLPTVYSPDSVQSATPIQERDEERPPSHPDPDGHFPRSPSREWAWAEALRRLENIHLRRPVDFTQDETGDNLVTPAQTEFDHHQIEGSAMSEEGDYETIMYESEGESRARSLRGPGRDNTDESVFSLDAVVRRIANEPPRERGRR
ncbi:hypothetical protein V492_07178 [Pseudogymnoascus sp. VKM F-4246]|nr:hypothetical protein V492_07178 [Pseudogymnoascus sp. VKM F-4246]